MKDIRTYITEATNTEYFFLWRDARRSQDDFTFNVGDECILMRYDTDGYRTSYRGLVKVTKVLKKTVTVQRVHPEDYSDDSNEWLAKLKFDKTGIFVEKNKNRYRGNSTVYSVLYNKEIIDDEHDKDMRDILADEGSRWGFRPLPKEDLKVLKQEIKEIK